MQLFRYLFACVHRKNQLGNAYNTRFEGYSRVEQEALQDRKGNLGGGVHGLVNETPPPTLSMFGYQTLIQKPQDCASEYPRVPYSGHAHEGIYGRITEGFCHVEMVDGIIKGELRG